MPFSIESALDQEAAEPPQANHWAAAGTVGAWGNESEISESLRLIETITDISAAQILFFL